MSEGGAKKAKTMPVDEVDEKVIIYKIGTRVPKDVTKIECDPSVTEIEACAFQYCKKLKEVELNEGLINIGFGVFMGCSSLTSITLPSTVTEIGRWAFIGCTNLKEILLNEGLEIIEVAAFSGCELLTSIALPSTVTEIGEGAFHDCNNLSEIMLHEGLQKIGKEQFDRRALEHVKFPSISKRVKNLLDAGHSQIREKFANIQHFEWNGHDLVVSSEAIRERYWCDDWVGTKGHLNQILSWISYYELKEATSTIELAMWKAKIEETKAVTIEERNSCRVDVPGPAKDAILKYLKHGEDVDNADQDDDDEGSSSSSYYESSDEDEEEE